MFLVLPTMLRAGVGFWTSLAGVLRADGVALYYYCVGAGEIRRY